MRKNRLFALVVTSFVAVWTAAVNMSPKTTRPVRCSTALGFSRLTARPARNLDDVNSAAAKVNFGIVRRDYHSYVPFAFKGEQI